MPRRGGVKQKQIKADAIYNSRLVTRLINRSMRDGKKSVAQKQIYNAFEKIKESGVDPMQTFSKALDNIRPNMEVRPRRVGGAAYQIPVPVRGARKDSLAIRWLIASARSKDNSEYHTYGDKLSAEILEASKGEGGAVKKKTDTEKMAEANRAFAHFRW